MSETERFEKEKFFIKTGRTQMDMYVLFLIHCYLLNSATLLTAFSYP